MATLLRGGELLLTTGLGLVGTGDRQLGRYVESMAEAGLAALAIELGRTYSEVPAPMIAAARKCDLPLIALRSVVPFEAVVEAFHTLLLDREMHDLRIADSIWKTLLERVLAGEGLQSLVFAASTLCSADAHLLARDGRVITSTRPDSIPTPSPANSRPVEVAGAVWGTLVLGGTAGSAHMAVLDRCATALGLELLRTGGAHDASTAVNSLIRDVTLNRISSSDELVSRLELAGLPMLPGRSLIAIAIAADRRVTSGQIRAIAQRSCREHFGTALVGELGEDVILLTHAPRGTGVKVRGPLQSLTAGVSGAVEAATGHHVIAVAAGAPAIPTIRLARSIDQAVEVVAIARRLGARQQAFLARDVGIYRLLSRLTNERELNEFVTEQIGVLLDHDAGGSSELVHTLDAYLRCGLAKTETAHALGIRRQTLYNRLERIESFLGPVLDSHESRTALALALHAWRLRTGILPREPLRPT